ncbi:hypothetical protein OGATHE_003958 [Ogataea polymorpha]|uniref:Uncharacterized protein n=1 Tax=Ogataea polymorpha TaxID=460523 RepID=A0A9P8P402_9ASCO|nr:hypothetical protein OGATHE_003958 [Ogataea polymorpha]
MTPAVMVGKSALTIRLTQSEFANEYDPTIEDSYRHYCEINGVPSSLDILDTAGQEEYSSMRDLYMKTGEGFLLVFSLTDRKTFEEISSFYNQIMRVKGEQVAFPPLILVGNKSDLVDERQVSKDEAVTLASRMGCAYIETSAKTGLNVTEAFHNLVKIIINNGYKHAGLVGTTFPDPSEEAKERQKQATGNKKGKKEARSATSENPATGTGTGVNGSTVKAAGANDSSHVSGAGTGSESKHKKDGSGGCYSLLISFLLQSSLCLFLHVSQWIGDGVVTSLGGGGRSSRRNGWSRLGFGCRAVCSRNVTNSRSCSSDRNLGSNEAADWTQLLLGVLQCWAGLLLNQLKQLGQLILGNLCVGDDSIIDLFLVLQVKRRNGKCGQSGREEQSPEGEPGGQLVKDVGDTCDLQSGLNVLRVDDLLQFELGIFDEVGRVAGVFLSVPANHVPVFWPESRDKTLSSGQLTGVLAQCGN